MQNIHGDASRCALIEVVTSSFRRSDGYVHTSCQKHATHLKGVSSACSRPSSSSGGGTMAARIMSALASMAEGMARHQSKGRDERKHTAVLRLKSSHGSWRRSCVSSESSMSSSLSPRGDRWPFSGLVLAESLFTYKQILRVRTRRTGSGIVHYEPAHRVSAPAHREAGWKLCRQTGRLT